jgi:parallel beta-helix repeat protein
VPRKEDIVKRFVILAALVAFVSIPAPATVIHVPGDYPTIQEGIDACAENDTVMVADGIYFENVVINMPISLIGENRDGVVIDGSDIGDVVFVDAPDVYLHSFTVRNSGAEYYDSGIELSFADNCVIDYCRFDANYSGLLLYGSTYNIISRCAFLNNNNGIRLYEGPSGEMLDNRDNQILNNIIGNSETYGIFFEHTAAGHHRSNLIMGNLVLNNDVGISMIMSYDNQVQRNDISASDGYGIFHMVCEGGGGNNVFHHNNFYSNNEGDIQACNGGLGDDYWYDYIENEGSYWSDYTGPDQNGDGIGDIPYDIDGDQSQDIYPLMEPLSATVSGSVSDGLEPIEGVYVEAVGTDIHDITGYHGGYSLPGLGAGMYGIFFSHPAFRDTVVNGVPTTPGTITELSVVMEFQTGIEENEPATPDIFALHQNYPNPFNARTVIEYTLPESHHVTVKIFDILGNKIETLVDQSQTAGHHKTVWNADGSSSGIYFYRIKAGGLSRTMRMILLK